MTDKQLSPASQAVLTAVTQQEYCLDPSDIPNEAGRIGYLVAAALRAAVDQVAPEDFDYWYGIAGDYANGYENGQNERNTQVRAELLKIADEMEGKK
jgi:hypothetical protein